MGDQDVSVEQSADQYRAFMKKLLGDVRALERMLDEGQIETGLRRIGAEQELFLVDDYFRPKCIAMRVLDRIADPHFTTELAQFNLEVNLEPREFVGDCLRRLEEEVAEAVRRVRAAAREEGGQVVMTGILPTLRKLDLGLKSMTPLPRYLRLNNAVTQVRGGEFHFSIKGIDELNTTHDNVMLESCNTSFQIHFQVGPAEFARLYNLAQAITAPVLAAAVNSPLLLSKRLWHETRVALFQQSVDERSRSHQTRGLRPRVSFGDDWVDDSVLEIFREDVARFRVILPTEIEEDPEAVLARGELPELRALRMHNGTIYRWNRPCYGLGNGKAQLRIENRALPAGPTVLDEVANAALFYGLMTAIADEHDDVRQHMHFDDAKNNFLAAARMGLRAQFMWLKGREYSARDLILEELIPKAREGLKKRGIDAQDIDRYLGVLEERVQSGRTGAQWALDSMSAFGTKGTLEQRLRTLTQNVAEKQIDGNPVHTWDLCELDPNADMVENIRQVGQYMTTDLFTVREGDVVDLAASLMEWRHIRHVPVENDRGQLAGIVSHRALLRLVGRGIAGTKTDHVLVDEIMKRDPVTVSPGTATVEAIEIMRREQVGCLPVVEDGVLVGIITERDVVNACSELILQFLREPSTS